MKLRKKTTLALLLLISLVLPVLLSGCGTEKWSSFKAHGEKDIYTCTLNSTTEFWYSPTYLYGEWIKGDQTVPMTIRFTAGNSAEPDTNCVLRFHDEYGSCMAELVMEMNKFRTNQSKSVCRAAGELIVYDIEKQEILQSLVDGIKFVGKTVYKTEKGNMPAYTPIQQSIFDFLSIENDYPVLMCEELNFWYIASKGYPHAERQIDGEWCGFSMHVDEDTLTFYTSYIMPCRTLMVGLDEDGYFLRNKVGDEILCARIERATLETDPRREIPYYAFMFKTDEQGNAYRFVCESEDFYIDGDTQTGVWTNGTDSIAIELEDRYWDREICIYTENGKELLVATFEELLEDGSARFRVITYSGVFPPTEIILKKELIESQN